MPASAQRSLETTVYYERETGRLVAQCQREISSDGPWTPLVRTVQWFLDEHGRWTGSTIRLYANALEQEMGRILEFDSFDPDSEEALLLRQLKEERPSPAVKIKKSGKAKVVAHQQKVAIKKKKKRKPRKSIPVSELRELVRYLRSKGDEFSLRISGYIILASRLGWRPGEMLALQREGHFLRSDAEKHTNGRGLMDRCEIDISAHLERSRLIKSVSMTAAIDKWLADIHKWKTYYGGLPKLHDDINAHLARACKKRKIKRVCTYTFRHFAISCLKASGFSCAEIVVIVNHASDRTAGEHYGRRRHGFRRAKKMLRFDQARLPRVRAKARKFARSAALAEKAKAALPNKAEIETTSVFASEAEIEDNQQGISFS